MGIWIRSAVWITHYIIYPQNELYNLNPKHTWVINLNIAILCTNTKNALQIAGKPYVRFSNGLAIYTLLKNFLGIQILDNFAQKACSKSDFQVSIASEYQTILPLYQMVRPNLCIRKKNAHLNTRQISTFFFLLLKAFITHYTFFHAWQW